MAKDLSSVYIQIRLSYNSAQSSFNISNNYDSGSEPVMIIGKHPFFGRVNSDFCWPRVDECYLKSTSGINITDVMGGRPERANGKLELHWEEANTIYATDAYI